MILRSLLIVATPHLLRALCVRFLTHKNSSIDFTAYTVNLVVGLILEEDVAKSSSESFEDNDMSRCYVIVFVVWI